MGGSVGDVIDLELLSTALEDDGNGVGEDLRTSADPADFFTLKDLRADARLAEREAAASPEAETPILDSGARKWAELSTLAQQLLTTRTKDLEIAGWLCEAATRLNSWQGMAQGLQLMHALMDGYWDWGLHPGEDEDGVETRVAPVGALLGLSGAAALLQPIKLLPLSDKDAEVALWMIDAVNAPAPGGDDAEARDRAQAKRAERAEQIRQGVTRASPAFLRATRAAVATSLETIDLLVDAVDAKAQTGGFGSQVSEPLRAVLALYEQHVGHLFAPEAEGVGEGDGEGEGQLLQEDGQEGPGGPRVATGAIRNRHEAYEAILRIADFFAASEPQSLVAKSLREVVRRARLPLEELLAELIPEPEQRHMFLLRAGVREEPAAGGEGGGAAAGW